MSCSNDVEWFRGRAMGDPHIGTLDSKSYTFNGKGEYILLQVSSVEFALQGRTDQATNSQGNLTTATVFVAFAAKEGNSTKFQVELSDDKTAMVITANDMDISADFYAESNYTFENNDLTVERQDRNSTTVVVAAFPSNIAVEVYVGIKNLEFAAIVPTTYKGQTTGMMGNYNDDNTDDFILPDGTQLTNDQTDTERKIFENFGREWEVTSSTTIFKYASGESALTYQFPNFEPMFREEVNQTLLAEAEQTCGAQQDACIFDLLATGDQAFAEATRDSAQEEADLTQSLNNNLPVLSLTTALNSQSRWQVVHGQESTLQFSATDADNDIISFELVETVNGVTVGNSSGVLAYTPDHTSSVVIGVRASDGKGKSSPIYVDLVVCTGCNGHGACDFSQTRETEYEAGRFLIAACSCWPAYEGDDCDQDANGCADDPCGDELNCTDITAAQQGNQTVGYLCEDCPDGYSLQGSSCVDTNECITNGTVSVCPQNSDCANTIGSYSCSCSTGYRTDPADAASCKDIDECSERIHDCEQVCDNTPGGFNCSCYGAGTLNQDGKTCTAVGTCNVTCQHFCQQNDDGSTECNCRNGYVLNANGQSCDDLDECSGKSLCSQGCTNTIGGFTCYCFSGFTLAADNTSCTECETSYWGANCANQCQCNGHGTCDRTRGCVCNSGWSGTRCVTDVNECAVDGACSAGQVCTNTIGSYTCACSSGYETLKGACVDIDECDDVLLHNCDLTTQDCSNNVGSYSCVCRTGYARNANNECADIDECSVQSHGCEQICENTDGSYNCDCYNGFRLDTDRRNCVEGSSNPCDGVTSLNCSQICTVDTTTNTAQCLCNSGYGLVGTETCQDINECDFSHLNLCGYTLGCQNTIGGFTCSCANGFQLDNDERSCVACGSGKWGQNCANSCECDWEGASSCDSQIGCVCNTGFTGQYCADDVDECASGSLTCAEGEQCVNTRGSAECQCIQGYRRVLGTCTDLDECAILSNNDCDQICTNYAGGYECSCNAGYTLSGNQCVDVDECAIKADGCEQGCENSEGSYRCTCSEGLKLSFDALSCIVEDACVTRTDCTDTCAIVNNVETCFCPRGKELDGNGYTCNDIDLCADAPCASNCNETADGTNFFCSCDPGQKLANNGFNCSDCVEGKYGDECSQTCTCSAIGTASCDKVSGNCNCNSGWSGADCATDVDECTDNSHNCTSKPDSTCENTPGSFVCKCDDGFYTNRSLCSACQAFTFGDECTGTCDCNREYSSGCNAVSGACTCQDGWTGTRCDTDIDECAVNNNCTLANRINWVCANTPGSFVCQCDEGYEDSNGVCTDIDECAADFTNVCNQNCTNSIGNYTCSCNSGYSLASDGRTCEDLDECTTGQHSCEDICTNAEASYTCSCNSGRELDSDNRNCYNALSTACTATLNNLNGGNLKEPLGADYINMHALVQPKLFEHFSMFSSGLTKLIINAMRSGSVIVDFTTVINTETTDNGESQVTDALIALVTNGITINGTFSTVNVVIGSLTVTSTTDKCEIMAALSACADDETCLISESGSAYYLDIPLIVGLSVGLPLGILAIVAIAFACWYKKKYKGQKRVNSRMDNYNDEAGPSSRRSSPDPFTAFKTNQLKSSLIEVD
ncbi:fibrillin-1 [Elysia marginata]|uniref:protein disulfide-isomerase n=1 Tax=Elysia marginata TaxID=1093978 RepID=A0AAV4ITI6_9GAST|nr:fibrillin-1 [Elysia marginata]